MNVEIDRLDVKLNGGTEQLAREIRELLPALLREQLALLRGEPAAAEHQHLDLGSHAVAAAADASSIAAQIATRVLRALSAAGSAGTERR